MHILDVLKERGFVAQVTFEEDLYKQLEEPTTFYVGFDPTADSLHIGHYIPIMAMAHMQRAGHRPIALMGGGTGMIGDPSGKSDLRKVLTVDDIDHNVESIKKQMSRFLDFSEGKAMIANNADWLRNLNYIDFMREIGVYARRAQDGQDRSGRPVAGRGAHQPLRLLPILAQRGRSGRAKVPGPADLPAHGRGAPPGRAEGQRHQRGEEGARL